MKNKNVSSAILSTLATGAIVGTTAYMMTQSNHKKQKSTANVKKYAGKALKTVGSVIQNATDIVN